MQYRQNFINTSSVSLKAAKHKRRDRQKRTCLTSKAQRSKRMSSNILTANETNVNNKGPNSPTKGQFLGSRKRKPEAPQATEYLTIQQFARLVGIRHETIRKHLIAGKLLGVRFGKSWRIPRSVLTTGTNTTHNQPA